jgi:uncharacterized membrane protein YkvA (DUF1232 family)
MNLDHHLEELEEQGYTLLPGLIDRNTTAEIREFIDRTIAEGHVKQPERGSNKFQHRICHPIEDPIMVRLASEPTLPRAAKLALGAAVLYLASPVDLLPDFIPFVGYVDDLLLAAIVLDGLLNYVDRAVVLRYWPGSVASLEKVARIAHALAIWVPARLKERIFASRGR